MIKFWRDDDVFHHMLKIIKFKEFISDAFIFLAE